jgi:transposase
VREFPATAALLLITAGDHPERLRSEAAWAHLCGVAPIPASSGRCGGTASIPAGTARPTMPCGGCDHTDERAPRHPRLRGAAHQEGLSKKEIIRCPKRYVARQVYPRLRVGC